MASTEDCRFDAPAAAAMPLWAGVLPVLAATALVAVQPGRRLYSTLLSCGVFALAQWLMPRCRFRIERYLCPLNYALTLFFVKLVVLPLLVMVAGPFPGTLPRLPSRESMETVVIIETFAYAALCVAVQLASGRRGEAGSGVWALLDRAPSAALCAVFAGLGMVGFLAAFGSLGILAEYYVNPAIAADVSRQVEGTWSGLLGTVLRPFLAFSLVLVWCKFIDAENPPRGLWGNVLVMVAVAAGVVAANLTFSFNRASFVFPLVTMAAVFVSRVKRVPPAMLAALGLAALAPVYLIGVYRGGNASAAELVRRETNPPISWEELSAQLQVYAAAPQFPAYFLEHAGWGRSLYAGSTLVASALSPVPVLGKEFRDASGMVVYNRAIYGNNEVVDQIMPFQGELFVNFHIVGVAAGYFALGLLLGTLQRQFEAANASFGVFAIQYLSLWTSTLVVWGLTVLSQILVFFCCPIYVYVAWSWVRRRTQ